MQTGNVVRKKIYGRTGGACHLCHGKLALVNYGRIGARGAWEIEHSVPRAKGGTDSLNNLYAAHISCNRSKGVWSTRSARRQFGQIRAPLSFARRRQIQIQRAVIAGVAGGALGYWVAAQLEWTDDRKWLATVAGAALCAMIAYQLSR